MSDIFEIIVDDPMEVETDEECVFNEYEYDTISCTDSSSYTSAPDDPYSSGDDAPVLEINETDELPGFVYDKNERYQTRTRSRLHFHNVLSEKLHRSQLEIHDLRWRVRILSALCGLEFCPIASSSAVLIQSHCRGLLVRNEKERMQNTIRFILCKCREFISNIKMRKRHAAAVCIQCHKRGTDLRRTVIGRSVSRVIEMRRQTEAIKAVVYMLSFRADTDD